MLQEALCAERAGEINFFVQCLPSTGGETEAWGGGGLAKVTPLVSGLARKGG